MLWSLFASVAILPPSSSASAPALATMDVRDCGALRVTSKSLCRGFTTALKVHKKHLETSFTVLNSPQMQPMDEGDRCRAAGPPIVWHTKKRRSTTRCSNRVASNSVAPYCTSCLLKAGAPGQRTCMGLTIITDKGYEAMHAKNEMVLKLVPQMPLKFQMLTREINHPSCIFWGEILWCLCGTYMS